MSRLGTIMMSSSHAECSNYNVLSISFCKIVGVCANPKTFFTKWHKSVNVTILHRFLVSSTSLIVHRRNQNQVQFFKEAIVQYLIFIDDSFPYFAYETYNDGFNLQFH